MTQSLKSVIFVPGIIMPVNLSYSNLLEALKDEIDAYPKDLEVYKDDAPPVNYTLDFEVEGIKRSADGAGLESFHLVGYSGGGASSLAFTAKYPERLKSLALIEPAWIGNQNMSPDDYADWDEIERLLRLPNEERLPAFMRWQMKAGIDPPELPKGEPPTWMSKRPKGIEVIVNAFKSYNMDRERFRTFNKPVYYALGGLSREIYRRMANTLKNLFPSMMLEVYENRSHLDPPHRAEAERFANALRELWNQPN